MTVGISAEAVSRRGLLDVMVMNVRIMWIYYFWGSRRTSLKWIFHMQSTWHKVLSELEKCLISFRRSSTWCWPDPESLGFKGIISRSAIFEQQTRCTRLFLSCFVGLAWPRQCGVFSHDVVCRRVVSRRYTLMVQIRAWVKLSHSLGNARDRPNISLMVETAEARDKFR